MENQLISALSKLDVLKNDVAHIIKDLEDKKSEENRVRAIENDNIKLNEKVKDLEKHIDELQTLVKTLIGFVLFAVIGAIVKLVIIP